MTATIQELLAQATKQLEEAGIESARLDASLLLAHVMGLTRENLLMNGKEPVNSENIERLKMAVARRAQREPIAYIIEKKEFWSLDFSVTRDTLIPRPDSETLVAAALKRVQKTAKPIQLLDIGTGTGCLLITLLKELPGAQGIGVDNNGRALKVAEENAKRLGVASRAKFVQSHWCDALQGTFDLIVSNPPYIAEADAATLMQDVVAYEPRGALFAGRDGLDAYRALSAQVAERLNDNGVVLFEVGQGQASAVEALLSAQGLKVETAEKDLGGIARCVIARKVH